MDYFEIILSAYGWQGIAFIATLTALLSIQIYFYAARFAPLGKYLIKKRKKLHETPPPVSLVVPMFSEDYDYLDDTLPLLLAQEGVEFEIVIVYVGCDNDFYEDMLRLKTIFSNFTATKIQRNERFPISVKTALNVGIKAAKYEHIVFSTTDAHPLSNMWLSLLSRGFQCGDVVLGYCGVERDDNKFDSYFIRATRLFESTLWLSKAIKGAPYRGIRSNIGFTRSLYFEAKGFNRLNMNIGEDDLFMQEIMKNDNASVIISPRATVMQRCWGRMNGLIDSHRFYGSAEPLYPISARNYSAWELTSRVLLSILVVVGIVFLPLELKILSLLVALIRLTVVLLSIKRVANRLGETKIVGRYIFFDALWPLFRLFLRIIMAKRDPRVWR